ncbi:glycosyltransferase [Lysobacter sp. LF1]|uniref:Glycosyltransferase n=1 Tax=Lysobacter stagni TaxID=3045172 RepID=A0ABT6XFJ8_9GAMM|nr:glycosyltransferase [Lysobacter sp. LF1]MDI9238831.1 glycosyltransferase [Lysobacter sp. LF1]
MKVAIVMSRLSNGGLERVQSHLAHAFAARGVDTVVAAGRVLHRHSGDFPDAVEVIEIARPGRFAFPFGLYRFLRQTRPDCLFTSSNDVACIAVVLKRLCFPRMRVIATHHLSLSGPIERATGWQRVKLLVVRTLMRALLGRADGHVAVTQEVASDVSAQTGLDPAHIRVIHNPIIGDDFTSRVAEAAPALPWPGPVIVFAGRLAPEKRIDLLVDAFETLPPSHDARLLIVGDGPQRAALVQRLAQPALKGRCFLTGFVANVFPWLAASDVLVLPSDYEGFGNVLVEAMACGIQVISTDCPHGPREILDNGRHGQLIPTGDATALRDALERTLSGQVRFDPAQLRARAAEFGIDRAAQAYLEIASAGVVPRTAD